MPLPRRRSGGHTTLSLRERRPKAERVALPEGAGEGPPTQEVANPFRIRHSRTRTLIRRCAQEQEQRVAPFSRRQKGRNNGPIPESLRRSQAAKSLPPLAWHVSCSPDIGATLWSGTGAPERSRREARPFCFNPRRKRRGSRAARGDARPRLKAITLGRAARAKAEGECHRAQQEPSPSRAARAFAALRPSCGRGKTSTRHHAAPPPSERRGRAAGAGMPSRAVKSPP
jgi:hypothetical protein